MYEKRVLLLSEGFGAGHTQAAHALAVGLRRRSSHVQTKVLELGGFLHPTLSSMIQSAYRRTIIHSPKLIGIMYRSQYKKSFNRFTQLTLHRLFYTQTAAMLKQLQPDIVVCTHPIPNAIISRLKDQNCSLSIKATECGRASSPAFLITLSAPAFPSRHPSPTQLALASAQNVDINQNDYGLSESWGESECPLRECGLGIFPVSTAYS